MYRFSLWYTDQQGMFSRDRSDVTQRNKPRTMDVYSYRNPEETYLMRWLKVALVILVVGLVTVWLTHQGHLGIS